MVKSQTIPEHCTIAGASVSSKARGTFACELVSLSGSADGISIAAVSAGEAGIFFRLSTCGFKNQLLLPQITYTH